MIVIMMSGDVHEVTFWVKLLPDKQGLTCAFVYVCQAWLFCWLYVLAN